MGKKQQLFNLKSSAGFIGMMAMVTAGLGAATALNAFDESQGKKVKEEVVVISKDTDAKVQVFTPKDGSKTKIHFIQHKGKDGVKTFEWRQKGDWDKADVVIDEDGNERRIFMRRSAGKHPAPFVMHANKQAQEKIEEKLAEIEKKLKKLKKAKKKDSLEYEALVMARDALKEAAKTKSFTYTITAPHVTFDFEKHGEKLRENIEEAMEAVKERKAEVIILQKHLGKELKESHKELERALKNMHKEFEKKELEGKVVERIERSLLRAEKEKLRALKKAEGQIEREIKHLERRLKQMERQEKELKKREKRRTEDRKAEKSKSGTVSL